MAIAEEAPVRIDLLRWISRASASPPVTPYKVFESLQRLLDRRSEEKMSRTYDVAHGFDDCLDILIPDRRYMIRVWVDVVHSRCTSQASQRFTLALETRSSESARIARPVVLELAHVSWLGSAGLDLLGA